MKGLYCTRFQASLRSLWGRPGVGGQTAWLAKHNCPLCKWGKNTDGCSPFRTPQWVLSQAAPHVTTKIAKEEHAEQRRGGRTEHSHPQSRGRTLRGTAEARGKGVQLPNDTWSLFLNDQSLLSLILNFTAGFSHLGDTSERLFPVSCNWRAKIHSACLEPSHR